MGKVEREKEEKRVGRNRGRDRQRYKEKESRRGRETKLEGQRETERLCVCLGSVFFAHVSLIPCVFLCLFVV